MYMIHTQTYFTNAHGTKLETVYIMTKSHQIYIYNNYIYPDKDETAHKLPSYL